MRRRPLVFLLAGEPSGDAIGAKLIAALRREHTAGPLRFAGVGGPKMVAAGLPASLFPMSDLSVMGFAELVPALPRLAVRFVQTLAATRAMAPDVVVGIDSKGFNLRVLRHLASGRSVAAGHPPSPALVQYVAPSAWAFADAPRRAAQLAETVGLDHLLVLLPFEVPLYASAGIPCTFVGHPALEADAPQTVAEERSATAARSAERGSALCLLPGSRRHEIDANLPHMLSAAERIAAELDGGGGSSSSSGAAALDRLLLPTPPSLRGAVEAHLRARPASSLPVIVLDDTKRHSAYEASCLALACCGTTTVELVRAGVPQVAVYRSSRLTSWLVRNILRPATPYATLPNILSQRRQAGVPSGDVQPSSGVSGNAPPAGAADAPGEPSSRIPELIFEACTAEAIAREALHLLRNPVKAHEQVKVAVEAIDELVTRDAQGQAISPSTVAAHAILKLLPPGPSDEGCRKP